MPQLFSHFLFSSLHPSLHFGVPVKILLFLLVIFTNSFHLRVPNLLIYFYTINSFFLHFLLSYCHSFFLISTLYFSLLSFFATLFFIILSFFSRSTLLILQLSFSCFVFPFISHSFLYVYLFILRRRTKPRGTVESANHCPVLISQLGSSAGQNSCKIHDDNRSGSFGVGRQMEYIWECK